MSDSSQHSDSSEIVVAINRLRRLIHAALIVLPFATALVIQRSNEKGAVVLIWVSVLFVAATLPAIIRAMARSAQEEDERRSGDRTKWTE